MKFEIHWNDLTNEKQDELRNMFGDRDWDTIHVFVYDADDFFDDLEPITIETDELPF